MMCYIGGFVDDKKEGEGKIMLTNGEVMEGTFAKGLLEGECCFTTLNGIKI